MKWAVPVTTVLTARESLRPKSAAEAAETLPTGIEIPQERRMRHWQVSAIASGVVAIIATVVGAFTI